MADFSARSAATTACRLLKKVHIKAEIARRREVAVEKLELQPEKVLQRLLVEMDGLGPDTNAGARLKAAELAGKYLGMFAPDSQVNVQVNNQMSMPPPLVIRGVATNGDVTDGTTIDQYAVDHSADDAYDSS
jgi:phage terminase small subunit